MRKTILFGIMALLAAGCTKSGPVDVTIQNVTLEAFAIKLTDSNWVAVEVGETYTFEGYETDVLENTQVLLFTADESPSAFSRVVNCGYYGCSEDQTGAPYGGGVKDVFFNLQRKRSEMFGGDTYPGITIIAESVDSLHAGALDRDAQKIKLRIVN